MGGYPSSALRSRGTHPHDLPISIASRTQCVSRSVYIIIISMLAYYILEHRILSTEHPSVVANVTDRVVKCNAAFSNWEISILFSHITMLLHC